MLVDEKPITVTAFAKSRGITRPTVKQYIDEGKIEKGIWTNPETGHIKIWKSIADEELGGAVDSERYPQAKANGKKVRKSTTKTKAPAVKDATPKTPPPNTNSNDSLVALKRAHEKIKVQKAALELRKKKGDLLDRQSVDDALFKFGKLIRDAVLAVPDRLSADLFAAATQGEVNTLLNSALEDALRQLSQLEKFDFGNE